MLSKIDFEGLCYSLIVGFFIGALLVMGAAAVYAARQRPLDRLTNPRYMAEYCQIRNHDETRYAFVPCPILDEYTHRQVSL